MSDPVQEELSEEEILAANYNCDCELCLPDGGEDE